MRRSGRSARTPKSTGFKARGTMKGSSPKTSGRRIAPAPRRAKTRGR